MAKSGTMQRGYRDVGYLFAVHVPVFRPASFPVRSWRRRLRGLDEHIRREENAAIKCWFKAHYPALMHLIPVRRHREFVAGFVERTQEEMALTHSKR